jgi:hypothetical protein
MVFPSRTRLFILAAAVLALGSSATLFWWLKRDVPQKDDPSASEEDTDASRSDVEDQMRSIGYVQ